VTAGTQRSTVAGPAGALECAVDHPTAATTATATDHTLHTQASALALVCHPHPLFGGTMDNKVVQTVARALVQCGYTVVRFNFRGVGASQGSWDEGRGEVDDALAVLAAHLAPNAANVVIAGFSFGGYVATQVAAQLAARVPAQPHRVLLVAPAVVNFTAAPVPAGTLLVHGETDDVVPLAAVLDWARPQQLPVTVLPGAGHFFHGQLPGLKQLVLRAFAPVAAAV
jgi:uncharacterized protein